MFTVESIINVLDGRRRSRCYFTSFELSTLLYAYLRRKVLSGRLAIKLESLTLDQ